MTSTQIEEDPRQSLGDDSTGTFELLTGEDGLATICPDARRYRRRDHEPAIVPAVAKQWVDRVQTVPRSGASVSCFAWAAATTFLKRRLRSYQPAVAVPRGLKMLANATLRSILIALSDGGVDASVLGLDEPDIGATLRSRF